jgi:Protein of unknown function (DUF2849)
MTSPLQQKIKIAGPVVVTANRVGDGAVIYRGSDGDWTTELGEAVVTSDPREARSLVEAAAADGLRAVDAYIAPVKFSRDGEVLPGNLRERIRRGGPTIDLPAALAICSVQDALRQGEKLRAS